MIVDMPTETPVQNGCGAPRATLLCRPNSHPFNDRNLVLDQEVKIGRSVARAKPTLNNAIFDCKVLSRNHAVLWYSLGKFYLQDTKSSNGTFVNNQRLSKGPEESVPREVCSGDILQFGVDVMENSRKVTHGCIIATLKLFLPDGKEAKASPSIENSNSTSSIPAQDLYQLNTFIQESLAREQLLENKLVALQKIVAETETASKCGWRALMDEDRLLTRLEILENQLSLYGKSMNEDKLREETKRLMDDKELYQIAAKENLKKLVDSKSEAVNKLRETETELANLENEFASMKTLYTSILEENKRLTEKMGRLTEKIQSKEKEDGSEIDPEIDKQLLIASYMNSSIQNGELVNGSLEDREEALDSTDLMISSTDSLDGSKPDSCVEQRDKASEDNSIDESTDSSFTDQKIDNPSYDADNSNKEIKPANNSYSNESTLNEINRLLILVEDLSRTKRDNEDTLKKMQEYLDEARHDSSVLLQELNNTKNKLEDAERLIESQDSLVKEMESRVQETADSDSLSEENLAPRGESHTQLSDDIVSSVPSKSDGSVSCQEDIQHYDELQSKISKLEEENLRLKEKLIDIKEQRSSTTQVIEESNADHALVVGSSVQTISPLETPVHQIIKSLEDHSDFERCKESDSKNESVEDGCDKSIVEDSVSMLNLSSSSCSDLTALEKELADAENKIAKLLQIKDKHASLQVEKSVLEDEVSNLREEVQTYSATSRIATFCNIVPLLVLLVAVVIAFLPSLSSILGTKDAL